MKKKKNFTTFANSDFYIECPWCGRGDFCRIGSCTTLPKETLNKLFAEYQEEQRQEESAEKNKQGLCAYFLCQHKFKKNEEVYYYEKNNKTFAYCSGCQKREEEKLNNAWANLDKLMEKGRILQADLEIESWEIETKKGEEIPESWQVNISAKKDQVDKKSREVYEFKNEWKQVKNWSVTDEWWNETGKAVEEYLEETDSWLNKLYLKCLTTKSKQEFNQDWEKKYGKKKDNGEESNLNEETTNNNDQSTDNSQPPTSGKNDQSDNNKPINNKNSLPSSEEINEQYQNDPEKEEIINSPVLKKAEEKSQAQEYLKKIVEAEILIKIKKFSAEVLQKLEEIATKPQIYQLLNRNKRVERAILSLQALERQEQSQPTNNNQYLIPLLISGGVIVLIIVFLLVVRYHRRK